MGLIGVQPKHARAHPRSAERSIERGKRTVAAATQHRASGATHHLVSDDDGPRPLRRSASTSAVGPSQRTGRADCPLRSRPSSKPSAIVPFASAAADQRLSPRRDDRRLGLPTAVGRRELGDPRFGCADEQRLTDKRASCLGDDCLGQVLEPKCRGPLRQTPGSPDVRR